MARALTAKSQDATDSRGGGLREDPGREEEGSQRQSEDRSQNDPASGHNQIQLGRNDRGHVVGKQGLH